MDFHILEPDKRILYMDNKGGVLIGANDVCAKSDRTFDVQFNDLARNEALLDVLNLVSMYASGELRGEDYAVSFFVSYLGSFYNDEGIRQQLEANPILRILVQDEDKLEKVREILGITK